MFLIEKIFHTVCSDHTFPPLQLLVDLLYFPTYATLQTLSLFISKTYRQTRNQLTNNQQTKKPTRNKTHKTKKSETTIYKQKTDKTKNFPKQRNLRQNSYKSTIGFVLCWSSTDGHGSYSKVCLIYLVRVRWRKHSLKADLNCR